MQRVLVGTTRARDDDQIFRTARSRNLSFLSFDVSVPPDRQLGQIVFPRRTPDPRRDFLTTSQRSFGSASSFQRELRTALNKLPPEDRETIIFVHGFNNTMTDGVFRTAQLMQDFGLRGVGVHYSWPSAENPFAYSYDRDSVLFARDGFEDLLKAVQRSGSQRTLIIAHSMGALLTMETLRQNPQLKHMLGGVLLLSPDIDVEVFRSQAEKIGKLPDPFVIFVSQKDRALRLSATLTGQRERLGTISNLEELADLDVTILDVTQFSSGGLNHFLIGDSPALIQLFTRAQDLDKAFFRDRASRPGLIPGTAIRIQNATQIILSPQSQ